MTHFKSGLKRVIESPFIWLICGFLGLAAAFFVAGLRAGSPLLVSGPLLLICIPLSLIRFRLLYIAYLLLPLGLWIDLHHLSREARLWHLGAVAAGAIGALILAYAREELGLARSAPSEVAHLERVSALEEAALLHRFRAARLKSEELEGLLGEERLARSEAQTKLCHQQVALLEQQDLICTLRETLNHSRTEAFQRQLLLDAESEKFKRTRFEQERVGGLELESAKSQYEELCCAFDERGINLAQATEHGALLEGELEQYLRDRFESELIPKQEELQLLLELEASANEIQAREVEVEALESLVAELLNEMKRRSVPMPGALGSRARKG